MKIFVALLSCVLGITSVVAQQVKLEYQKTEKQEDEGEFNKVTYLVIHYKDGESYTTEKNLTPTAEETTQITIIENGQGKEIIERREDKPIEWYINYKEKELVEKRDFYGKLIYLKRELPTFNWVLTNEEKKIGNFLCKKAVIEGLVAWYTEDLPLPVGPVFLNGLPGVIVKTESATRTFDLVSFENLSEEIKVEKPKGTKKIKMYTLEQYEKLDRSW